MKHEELVTKIEKGNDFSKFSHTFALWSVVKLHKPFDDDPDECGHCGDGYPCITIQVIEKELG